MSFLDKLATFGIKDLVVSVLDRIKLSPEKKAEIELQMAQNAHELATMQANLEARLEEIAAERFKSETTSDDKYVKRWRPTFAYVIILIYLNNYLIYPYVTFFKQGLATFLTLPYELHMAFLSYLLGYGWMRMKEKITSLNGGK